MTDHILILNYGRCSWGSCIFCGYGRKHGKTPETDQIIKELDDKFEEIDGKTTRIKVFGSGSFLDEKQIPQKARKHFIDKCGEKNILDIVIESRPEHITKEKIKEFKGLELTVAIGLESSDENTLKRISKGFSKKEYENAVQILRTEGSKIRTYLLVNPPDTEDIQKNLDSSIEYALKHSDSIVLINLLPHGNTPLLRDWINGEWNYLDKKEYDKITDKWKDNPKIELDYETFKFKPRFPQNMQKKLRGVGEEYLTHPFFEVWQDYILRFYNPPDKKKILLFLPCSYKKPYSESRTHRAIINSIKETGNREIIHEVMISNAGIIPREFEDQYPFNAYDWEEKDETQEIKERYIQVTKERIIDYLKAHGKKYLKTASYLKNKSDSYHALTQALEEIGMEDNNFISEKTEKKIEEKKNILQSNEGLTELSEGLKRLLQNSM